MLRRRLLFVFAVSLLALFMELCLIRWLPTQVRALSYFKNLVLISSFLGFGIGFLLQDRVRSLVGTFPLLLLLEIGVAFVLSQFRVTALGNTGEHLWLLYFDLPPTALPFPLFLAIPIFYVLNSLTFVPLGQWLAAAMADVGDSILAYVANVAGSIVGTLLFVLLSFAEVGPRLWFLPALLFYIVLSGRQPRARVIGLAALLLLLFLPLERAGALWSPYYAVRAVPVYRATAQDTSSSSQRSPATLLAGYEVSVNGSFHQFALNFDERVRTLLPPQDELFRAYQFPYRYYYDKTQRQPQKVLVIGAGTGNDVAIALDQRVASVDAVEIDPVILRLGQQLNPSRAYDDPRVRPHVADARSFLQNSVEQYDLVVFGTLDSQIALSALSTIRLDNYVYTVESLRQARRLLRPDGMLVLYFYATEEWIQARLVRIIVEAFGRPPEVRMGLSPGLFNIILIAPADPSVTASPESLEFVERLTRAHPRLSLSTDDWPYLYQRARTISPFYGLEILLLLGLSLVFVRGALLPRFGALPARGRNFHRPLFFQGMAFLLLETRSISIMSLIFGSTWFVSAIVIAAVLLVVMLANLAVRAWGIRHLQWPFVGLAATLIAGYLFPTAFLLQHAFPFRLVASILIYISPIFFSSIIFGILLRDSDNLTWAYGSNLLGAVVGGFGEYIASVTGLRALSLIALFLFVPVVLLNRA
ncbi:MAG: spermidine synthase, partial [Ardenticatenaceae bacterium]